MCQALRYVHYPQAFKLLNLYLGALQPPVRRRLWQTATRVEDVQVSLILGLYWTSVALEGADQGARLIDRFPLTEVRFHTCSVFYRPLTLLAMCRMRTVSVL